MPKADDWLTCAPKNADVICEQPLTGPYWAILGLTRPYLALLGLTFAFVHLLTNERTLRLIGLLSQPKKMSNEYHKTTIKTCSFNSLPIAVREPG